MNTKWWAKLFWSPPPYIGHLDTALTWEQAGEVARRLTKRHITDNDTLKDVWDLMDTITLMYADKEYPVTVKPLGPPIDGGTFQPIEIKPITPEAAE